MQVNVLGNNSLSNGTHIFELSYNYFCDEVGKSDSTCTYDSECINSGIILQLEMAGELIIHLLKLTRAQSA